MKFPAFLNNQSLQLILFGGKGGVGKTTCACASALNLATDNQGHDYLLLSTDPAHSIDGALADAVIPANLTIRELDAAASLRDFKSKHEKLFLEIADRGTFLDSEDLHGLLDLSLPGMDEVAAYLEIADYIKEGRYRCIVMDTAPTGHTLRLLEMPELVRRWLLAMDTLLAKHRYIKRHYTGDQSLDHLDRFLLDMDGAVQTIQNLLRDRNRCQFVLVMLAEIMSVEESLDLARALAHHHISMPELIINQTLPANDCPTCQTGRARQLIAIEAATKRLPKPAFWLLPVLPRDPSGKELFFLWSNVHGISPMEPIHQPANPLPVRVESPAMLPADTLRLLIFAGKGGVGKTTMACAAALRMHEQYPKLRILLFSTDPAHSLSDALGIPLGPAPCSVLSGLDAQEINAKDAFGEVREAYRKELERFLADTLPHLDITFDREVMEHLLDMAPPGLDEIMALTAISDHLGLGIYDLVVMDSAPSGHLLRLLDLPQLIGEWLKLFFSLLLKYKKVMRLPKLSERLVKLSRELKSLRKLLTDPALTALYAITIPTRLALDKTSEMEKNLRRIGLRSRHIMINQITPAGGCSLCYAIHQREATQIIRADTLFAETPKSLIYLQSDPGGLTGLSRLGRALFNPA